MTFEPGDLEPKLGVHSVMKTELRRYEVVDGVPTFKDSQLISLFERAKEERLFPLIMYNVNPDVDSRALLNMYKNSSGRMLWLVYYDDELAGWVWLDDLANRTARSHFCFFRWLSRARLTEDVGSEMFRQLLNLKFRNGVMLQVIRAEMPGFNKPALWFLKKLGFRVAGEIPDAAFWFSTGLFYPMIYLYAKKDMLNTRFQNVGSASPSWGNH